MRKISMAGFTFRYVLTCQADNTYPTREKIAPVARSGISSLGE